MGTIFKHNNNLIQCQNLQKKLKKLRLTENDIEIIQDNIPNEELEKTFCILVNGSIKEKEKTIEKIFKPYYYTNGENFTGVFYSYEKPPQISELPWCFGYELKEGTPDISKYSEPLQKIFKESWK